MQNPPFPLPLYMKDAHSAESNAKLYFRYFRLLCYELRLITFIIYDDKSGVPPYKKKSGQILS